MDLSGVTHVLLQTPSLNRRQYPNEKKGGINSLFLSSPYLILNVKARGREGEAGQTWRNVFLRHWMNVCHTIWFPLLHPEKSKLCQLYFLSIEILALRTNQGRGWLRTDHRKGKSSVRTFKRWVLFVSRFSYTFIHPSSGVLKVVNIGSHLFYQATNPFIHPRT